MKTVRMDLPVYYMANEKVKRNTASYLEFSEDDLLAVCEAWLIVTDPNTEEETDRYIDETELLVRSSFIGTKVKYVDHEDKYSIGIHFAEGYFVFYLDDKPTAIRLMKAINQWIIFGILPEPEKIFIRNY